MASLRLRVEQLLERFNLGEWRSVRLSHCSSGIRQRLAVARAVLHDPDVLLIDEPTRSLDAASTDLTVRFLKDEIIARGRTCIMVTHDSALAREVGTVQGSLRDGRIVTGAQP